MPSPRKPYQPPRGSPLGHPQAGGLVLPEFLGPALAAGHPWIYRDHIPRGCHWPSGTFVPFTAGSFRGWGLWDEESAIALRVFSAGPEPCRELFRQRVAQASELRREFLPARTNAYRLLYGEGDFLPGVTVDVYDGFAAMVTYANALDSVVPWVVDALVACVPLRGIAIRRDSGDDAPGTSRLETLWGEPPPANLTIEEYGWRFHADLEVGQKTGLFLDQRENRHFIESVSANRTVLNLFSYTGGFSVYAAGGGARRVTSVDIAKAAMARAEDNFRLNQMDPKVHQFVVADCYDYLRQQELEGRRFDLVISDPPSLARNRQQVHTARRAYVKLSALGISRVEVGGIYAGASCTAQISPEVFREILGEAAAQAGRRLQIVHEASHAPDHPIGAGHKEGRYLKFVVGRVLS
jgi:23S rRNA (cytosine1962-C5)-methyltransferase